MQHFCRQSYPVVSLALDPSGSAPVLLNAGHSANIDRHSSPVNLRSCHSLSPPLPVSGAPTSRPQFCMILHFKLFKVHKKGVGEAVKI